MTAKITSCTEDTLVIEITLPFTRSMLEGEGHIEQALNEAGTLATGELLKCFDTDGSPIQMGSTKLTSKGQVEKPYQTPYGETRVKRHAYQSPQGGATFCPLERDARIIQGATPKLAKLLSHKYSKLSVDEVKTDLQSNHGRALSRGYIQKVTETVGALAQAKAATAAIVCDTAPGLTGGHGQYRPGTAPRSTSENKATASPWWAPWRSMTVPVSDCIRPISAPPPNRRQGQFSGAPAPGNRPHQATLSRRPVYRLGGWCDG